MSRLTGIHAVREALEAGRALERILIARGRHGERIEALVQLARARGVPVRTDLLTLEETRVEILRVLGSR